MHYTRMLKGANLFDPPRGSATFEESFKSKYVETSGCWEWLSGKDTDGYAIFSYGGRSFRASRVAYRLAKGDFSEDMFICHSCDNPGCVNPDHLWVGTAKENSQDMLVKGRYVSRWKHLREEHQCQVNPRPSTT